MTMHSYSSRKRCHVSSCWLRTFASIIQSQNVQITQRKISIYLPRIKFLVANIKFYGAIISLEAGYFFASPLAVNHNWKNGFLSLPPLFHISSLGKFSFNSEMPTLHCKSEKNDWNHRALPPLAIKYPGTRMVPPSSVLLYEPHLLVDLGHNIKCIRKTHNFHILPKL